MKKITFLCVFLSVLIFADVVPLNNLDSQGYPVIIPTVQKLTPASGKYSFPKEWKVAAPKELQMNLTKFFAKSMPNYSLKAVSSKKAANVIFELASDKVPANPEGYLLTVSKSGIVIRAQREVGLFYGMQSLFWMLKNRCGEELKACRIEDWPSLSWRAIHFQLMWITPEKSSRLCDVIDMYGHLKMNMFLIDFGTRFPFKNNLFSEVKGGKFTMEQVEQIKAAAKRNHIELIPYLQLVSHTGYIQEHKDYDDLTENKNMNPRKKRHNDAYCLSNPAADALVKTMVTELCDALHPSYFHIGLDEISNCMSFRLCEKCKQKDPVELVMNHIKPIEKMLLDRGVTPIVYQDEFVKTWPGRISNQLRPVLDQLDKRDIVNIWDYDAKPSWNYFREVKERGFKDVFFMSWQKQIENVQNIPRMAYEANSFGAKSRGAVLSFWSQVPATLDYPKGGVPNAYPAWIIQANYSWNPMDEDFIQKRFDPSYEHVRLATPEFLATFKGKNSTLPLTAACNTLVGKEALFPEMNASLWKKIQKILDADKEQYRLDLQGDECWSIALSGSSYDSYAKSPVTVNVGCKAEGVSFLLTGAYFNGYLSRNINDSAEVGQIVMHYEDGSKAVQPLKYLRNINLWNSKLGGNWMRTVLRGNDVNGFLFNLYSMDFVNPHPEKQIKSLEISSVKTGNMAIIILAATLHGADKVLLPPPSSKPREAKRLMTATKETVVFKRDYEDGVPKAVIEDGKFWVAPITKSIVTLPGRGKVLKITVPPLKPQTTGRLVTEHAIPKDAKFKTIAFEIMCDHPEDISRSDYYLRGIGNGVYSGNIKQLPPDDASWHRICIPVEALTAHEQGGVKEGELRAIRIAYFLNNKETVNFYIDNIMLIEELLPGHYGFGIKQQVK